MIEEINKIKSEKTDLRKFGITIGIVLAIIAGFLFWKEIESSQPFIIVGIALFLLGFLTPVFLKPIYWIWMVFAIVLGQIMTWVILSLLFYFIFTPIGLIARLFRKQFLELKWDRQEITYWNYRSMGEFVDDKYEKQF